MAASLVIVKMPGGDLEYIDAKELLWARQAFDSEFQGMVMLRLTSDRIYSAESVAEIKAKFIEGGAAMTAFNPPAGSLEVLVNADRVREVEAPNPAIYHEQAGSVLKFGTKLKLAVRESETDAKALLQAALDGREPETSGTAIAAAAAAGGALLFAAVGAAAALSKASGSEPDRK